MIRQFGLTLIELMIVVAIVAIIASIAYPSYQEQMQKVRRSDAQSALMDAAAKMERFYTQYGRYTSTIASAGIDANSPEYYTISAGAITNQTFILQAVPIAGSAQAADDCGTFDINHAQVKSVSGSLSGQACRWE